MAFSGCYSTITRQGKTPKWTNYSEYDGDKLGNKATVYSSLKEKMLALLDDRIPKIDERYARMMREMIHGGSLGKGATA